MTNTSPHLTSPSGRDIHDAIIVTPDRDLPSSNSSAPQSSVGSTGECDLSVASSTSASTTTDECSEHDMEALREKLRQMWNDLDELKESSRERREEQARMKVENKNLHKMLDELEETVSRLQRYYF